VGSERIPTGEEQSMAVEDGKAVEQHFQMVIGQWLQGHGAL
jgi:hypothetical protein